MSHGFSKVFVKNEVVKYYFNKIAQDIYLSILE